MASSTVSSKVLCVVCNQRKGSFKCEGCLRMFCPKHSNDHRNDLSKQLEEIVIAHDLMQQIEDPQQHSLLKKVNQWEQESIVKIRQVAEEARNKLLKTTTEHTNKIKQKLNNLSDELRQAHDDNDFIEIDLQKWTKKLEELKKELYNLTTVTIEEDSTPLVFKILIDCHNSSDVFQRVCGIAQIKENGCLIVKDGVDDHREIRGKKEYISGQHILRFQIERLFGNLWIFFGIISKFESMQLYSHNSPSSYGWTTNNQIYVGGQCRCEQTSNAIENDTVTLSIDCDQRRIMLKNERTNCVMQLSIDTTLCPFPWQFHLNLYDSLTRVRILSVHSIKN
ncbi:unnamed protein product [Rotaria sp. Silwood1]|nr:unnamed protein product [Rotaria sp. Silwood1]CAF3580509.1 unnamed protein product [Rotaria sp. Silwood1]CAF3600846.1 unnamed protein product [Rotaria sp. Silwood1]CAF4790532.1 unnamed protein product [Rotaria sp. Silwood1]CAF4908871.1 unnamed protein product [Rotaria sp. Silwood1]